MFLYGSVCVQRMLFQSTSSAAFIFITGGAAVLVASPHQHANIRTYAMRTLAGVNLLQYERVQTTARDDGIFIK